MTRPGLDIFSPEWFDLYLTHCPEPVRPVVEAICSGYHLGNTTDPNTIARMVVGGLCQVFDYAYTAEDGATRFTPVKLALSEYGEFSMEALSGLRFTFEDVESREKVNP